ncbi:MAG: sugar ABC transporter permease [Oscillospiraceae bacterium]|nr:sugar ABC transporter permease [Oscillospiraceae bacterium]
MKKSKRRADDERVTAKTFLTPAAYLAPFMAGILIFTVWPFINVLLISFKENYKILSHSYSGFGFGNYEAIFSNPTFLSALKNTGVYVICVVPIATVLSLLIAVMLNNKIKLMGLFQTAYFMPMVTSVTAVGLVWRWLFNYDYGLVNYLSSLFGAEPINWLNDPKYAMVSLVIYGVWSMLPFTIILLLSGLQNINTQYYTAARADGARAADIFFRITVPLLAPTIGLVLIVNTITASKVFMELFPLFNGKPGPAYSLYTVIYFMYEQFYVKWKLGPAAACAVVLFFIVLIFTLLQLFVQRKWKNY